MRRPAVGALLAAALAVAASPGAAPAEECSVRKVSEWVATPTREEIADQNFACLERRIEALEQERDALARKLEQAEGGSAPGGGALRGARPPAMATFVLTGNRGGEPASLELDRARVLELCGDAEGCLMSLGLRGIIVDGRPVEAMFSVGPCAFHIDPQANAWALSGPCAAAELPVPAGGASAEGGPAEGGPAEDGPAWGRDGNAKPLGGPEPDGRIILGFAGTCLVAETAPDTRDASEPRGQFGRDTEPDLFLIAAGANWDPTGALPAALLPGPSNPDFQCRLTVRD